MRRRFRQQGEELSGHDSADGSFRIADEPLHPLPALGVDKRQDPLPSLFGQAVDDRHRIIRIGARNHAGHFVILNHSQDIRQLVRRKLLEGFGDSTHRGEDVEKPAHFIRVEILKKEGDVSRMRLGDQPKDAIRRGGSDQLLCGLVVKRRGFHKSLQNLRVFVLSNRWHDNLQSIWRARHGI